jgi:hypothetical protein
MLYYVILVIDGQVENMATCQSLGAALIHAADWCERYGDERNASVTVEDGEGNQCAVHRIGDTKLDVNPWDSNS